MKPTSSHDSNVSVSEIMRTIRTRLRNGEGRTHLDDNMEESMANKLRELAARYDLEIGTLDQILNFHGNWNLETDYEILSHRPQSGRIVVFVKKILRAFTGLFAKPVIHQQSEINRCLSAAVSHLLAENIRLEAALRSTQKRRGPDRQKTAAKKDRKTHLVTGESGKKEKPSREASAPRAQKRERRSPRYRQRRRSRPDKGLSGAPGKTGQPEPGQRPAADGPQRAGQANRRHPRSGAQPERSGDRRPEERPRPRPAAAERNDREVKPGGESQS